MGTQTVCAGLAGGICTGRGSTSPGEPNLAKLPVQPLGSKPGFPSLCRSPAEAGAEQELQGSMLWAQEQDQTVKLTVKIHLLEMSLRL